MVSKPRIRQVGREKGEPGIRLISEDERREGVAFVKSAQEIAGQHELGAIRSYIWRHGTEAFFPQSGGTDFMREALASAVENRKGGRLVVDAIVSEAKALDAKELKAGRIGGCADKVMDIMITIGRGDEKFWSVEKDRAELVGTGTT